MKNVILFVFLFFGAVLNDLAAQHPYIVEENAQQSPSEIKEVRRSIQKLKKDLPFIDPFTGAEDKAPFWEAQKIWNKTVKAPNLPESVSTPLQFVNRGPYNKTGRIDRLMFDPNDPNGKKIWALSNSGGLWSNNDISDINLPWDFHHQVYATKMLSMSYDPTQTQTFFLAGNNCWYKSTDAGSTWNLIAPVGVAGAAGHNMAIGFKAVSDIVVVNSTEMYASTLYGVCKSTDGGTTWTRVLMPKAPTNFPAAYQNAIGGTFLLTTSTAANVTALKQGTDGALYAAFSMGEIFKSTDGGTTWQNISPTGPSLTGGRTLLALEKSTSGAGQLIYAACGIPSPSLTGWLYKSADGGTTWTMATWPSNWIQFYDNMVLETHPHFPNMLYAGCTGVQQSLNAGQSYTPIPYPTAPVGQADYHDIDFSPVHPNLSAISNDQGVVLRNNLHLAAGTGEARYKGLVALQSSCVAQRNLVDDPMLVANPKDMPAQLLASPGPSNSINLSNNEGAWCTFDKDDANVLIYSSYPYTNTYVRNIATANTTLVGTFGQFALAPRDYDSQNNIAISYASTDANVPGRVHFDLISNVSSSFSASTNVKSTIAIDGLFAANGQPLDAFWGVRALKFGKNPNTLFVMGARNYFQQAALYKITDWNSASPTVTRIDNGVTWVSVANTIAIGATDDQLFVGLESYAANVETLYYTTDGGQNWKTMKNIMSGGTSASGLPNAFGTNWAAFNPFNYNEIYLTSYLGVVVCSDLSAAIPQFTVAGPQLAAMECNHIEIRDADGQIAVSTFGNGVWTASQDICLDIIPDIQTNIANQTVSPGQNASFSVTANNTTIYEWQVSTDGGLSWDVLATTNTGYSGQNTANLTVVAPTTLQTGYLFRCHLINGCAENYTQNGYLSVFCQALLPGILQQPTAALAYVGDNAVFNVNSNNTGSHQWQIKNASTGNVWVDIAAGQSGFSGQQTNTLTVLSAVLAQNNTQVRCILQNLCAFTTTNAVTLTVTCQSPFPLINTHPTDQMGTSNTAVVFQCFASYPVGYQWEVLQTGGTWQTILANDPLYTGQQSNVLTIISVSTSMDQYQYRCVSYGCQFNETSNAAVLSVTPSSGIWDATHTSSMSIVPNPASVEIELLVTDDVSQVEIIDQQGRICVATQHQKRINIADLPVGMYIVVVKNGQKTWRQKLVVVR